MQWFDANGTQWRFFTGTRTWQKLVGGRWFPATVPPGGLSHTPPTATEPEPEPETPDPGPAPVAGSIWVDEGGTSWRFYGATQRWQKDVDGQWVTAVPPSRGLERLGLGAVPPSVTVVEIAGPPGPEGPRGPVGPSSLQVAEVIAVEYQDGINDTFSLSDLVDLDQAVLVLRNGLMEVEGHGYLMGSNSVTFTTPPLDSDVLTVVYKKAQ